MTNAKLNGDTLQFVNKASDPASGTEGEVYYNSTDNVLKVYDGAAWKIIGQYKIYTGTGVLVGINKSNTTTTDDLKTWAQANAVNTIRFSVSTSSWSYEGSSAIQQVRANNTVVCRTDASTSSGERCVAMATSDVTLTFNAAYTLVTATVNDEGHYDYDSDGGTATVTQINTNATVNTSAGFVLNVIGSTSSSGGNYGCLISLSPIVGWYV